MKFDISLLIAHLGGTICLADALGVGRGVPHGWVRRDFISSRYLSKIKEVYPDLDLNRYFVKEYNGHLTGSTRIQ